jgi:hypothetical protein
MQEGMKLQLRKNEIAPIILKVIYHIWASCAPPKKGRVETQENYIFSNL